MIPFDEFTEADLPTLRKLRDMMKNFYDEAPGSNDSLIYRIQTRFTYEFCKKAIEKVEGVQQT